MADNLQNHTIVSPKISSEVEQEWPPASFKDHDTARIVLVEADVDLKMIPVIKWLNSFRSLYTEYCCQGSGKIEKPYVLIRCFDWATIAELSLHLHREHLSLEINPPLADIHPYARLFLQWSSTEELDKFVQKIPSLRPDRIKDDDG